jgi:hypothetical protein
MYPFDRGSSGVCLGAALIAASMLWAVPARAQGDTAKPSAAQPSTSTQQAPSTNTVPDLHLQSLSADPCKAQKPPPYCAKL